MKKDRYMFKFILALIVASLILYLINYAIFKDLHHIGMFFTEDLAFIPIEVLVTVLIIERALEKREKKHKLQKINLLIEIFFEEVGNQLLRTIAKRDNGCDELCSVIPKIGDGIIKDFNEIKERIERYICKLNFNKEDIEDIYTNLNENKETLFRFIENPYLDEHDIFTDLLQAAVHLHSEIKLRKSKGDLTSEDISHLNSDILRLYKYLTKEWIVYMKYIEKEYPFLYSFALKNIPFKQC